MGAAIIAAPAHRALPRPSPVSNTMTGLISTAATAPSHDSIASPRLDRHAAKASLRRAPAGRASAPSSGATRSSRELVQHIVVRRRAAAAGGSPSAPRGRCRRRRPARPARTGDRCARRARARCPCAPRRADDDTPSKRAPRATTFSRWRRNSAAGSAGFEATRPWSLLCGRSREQAFMAIRRHKPTQRPDLLFGPAQAVLDDRQPGGGKQRQALGFVQEPRVSPTGVIANGRGAGLAEQARRGRRAEPAHPSPRVRAAKVAMPACSNGSAHRLLRRRHRDRMAVALLKRGKVLREARHVVARCRRPAARAASRSLCASSPTMGSTAPKSRGLPSSAPVMSIGLSSAAKAGSSAFAGLASLEHASQRNAAAVPHGPRP